MINVYKKTERSKQNPSGYVEISGEELDKPFLCCISAQDMLDKSIFGTIRQGAQAARVYTPQDKGAGYKIEEFPVDFLGFKYKKDDMSKDNTTELVENFLYPYLSKEGLGKEKLTERARKMNFMTYCDGTNTYRSIEQKLTEKLTKSGLSEEDIKDIISGVHLVAIGTGVDTRSFECTSLTLIDANDNEIWNGLTDSAQENMTNRNSNELYGQFNDKNGYYYYKGTGNHDLIEYFRDGVAVKPILHYAVSKTLEASVNNKEYKLTDIINGINSFNRNGRSQEELLNEIDNTANYGNIPKYTQSELELRRELDELYYVYRKTSKENERLEKSEKNKNQGIKNIIDGIKKYSSDVTFYQILVEAGYWQAPRGVDPYSFPSDKEIRNMMEQERTNESNMKL